MSEENKNEHKPDYVEMGKEAISLKVVVFVEPADEKSKELTDEEVSLEITIRCGQFWKTGATAKLPVEHIGALEKTAGAIVSNQLAHVRAKLKEGAAFQRGYEAAKKEAENQPSTGEQKEATPSSEGNPEGGTGASATE